MTVAQTQSREEQRYKHTLDAAITIYRTEGWRAFFRGLFPSLLGITHVAVQFPLYEFLKSHFSTHAVSLDIFNLLLTSIVLHQATATPKDFPHNKF